MGVLPRSYGKMLRYQELIIIRKKRKVVNWGDSMLVSRRRN